MVAIGVDCLDEVRIGDAGALVGRLPVQVVEAEPDARVERVQPDGHDDVGLRQVGGDLEADLRVKLDELVGVRQAQADVALDDDVDEPGPDPGGLGPVICQIDLQGRGGDLSCEGITAVGPDRVDLPLRER